MAQGSPAAWQWPATHCSPPRQKYEGSPVQLSSPLLQTPSRQSEPTGQSAIDWQLDTVGRHEPSAQTNPAGHVGSLPHPTEAPVSGGTDASHMAAPQPLTMGRSIAMAAS